MAVGFGCRGQELGELRARFSQEKRELQESIDALESANGALQAELQRVMKEYAECKLEYEIESVAMGLEQQQDASRQREELEQAIQRLNDREEELQAQRELERLEAAGRRQSAEQGRMEAAESAARLAGQARAMRAFRQSLSERESHAARREREVAQREEAVQQLEQLLHSEQRAVAELGESCRQKLEDVNRRAAAVEKTRADVEKASRALARRESDSAYRLACQEAACESARCVLLGLACSLAFSPPVARAFVFWRLTRAGGARKWTGCGWRRSSASARRTPEP